MRFEGRRAPSNACGIGGGQPGNGDPLAPRRLPSLLALAIKASRWPAEDATRDPTAHSRNEHCEPAMRCAADTMRPNTSDATIMSVGIGARLPWLDVAH